MSNVSFGLQSFVFIISLVIALAGDGFTIYLDGGGEFKTLGKDLAALKDDVNELRQSLQTMKDNARGSGKACTVKMANERSLSKPQELLPSAPPHIYPRRTCFTYYPYDPFIERFQNYDGSFVEVVSSISEISEKDGQSFQAYSVKIFYTP